MKKQANPRPHEQGSVIVWILIGVVLFAALSVAMNQGSRTGVAKISEDQARLAATEILSYGRALKDTVHQLRINGCTDTQISFDYGTGTSGYENTNAPTDNSCHVFHPDGGGLTWMSTLKDLHPINTGYDNYRFIGRSAVQDVGTSEGELYMWLRTRSRETCMKYNDMAGVTNPSSTDAPSDTGFYGVPLFTGSYSSGTTVTGGGALNGKMTGCYKDTENDSDGQAYYDFYQVLIPR